MAKKNVDRAVLALFVIMAVLLFRSTADYTGIAQKTSANYVRFLAVFVGVLCALQLAFSLAREAGDAPLKLTDHLPRFLGLLIALICFALVFEHLGFFVSAAVFIPVVAWMLGFRRPVAIVLTTAAVLAFVYLVFVQLLSVNLPGLNF